MATPLVMHFDADAFFAQVEQQLDPTLAGTPFAVQQHQDTIAISYAARALGIKKHTAPAEIRRRWPAVRLVHVAVVGGKTTYKCYRRASAAIYRVLRSFGRPLERRGMDEGFIDLTQGAAAAVLPTQPDAARYAWAAAEAERMRAAVRSATGYVISIGIGGNKLVAKLASRAAKPDGCRVIRSDEVAAFFEALPVEDLPQCGGQIADGLKAAHKVTTCSQAQALTLAQLTEACGGNAKKAEMVHRACRAEDPSPVVPSGPPKSIQSQCSLTPLVLLQHAADGGAAAPSAAAAGGDGEQQQEDQHVVPAGDGSGSSLLDPTPPWAIARVKELLQLLIADIVERVDEDCHEHHRHPTTLVLTAQLYTCSPKEVGTFGQMVSGSSSTSSSSAPSSTICQLYEGGAVVWPRHSFLPRGAAAVGAADVASMPTIAWTRGAGDLAKGSGQSTSRSAPFPAGVLTALRAAARGGSSSSSAAGGGAASSSAAASGDADPAAVAAAEAALMSTAEKLYVAAARAAAEADGWHWNGLTVSTGSIPISAAGGDGATTRAASTAAGIASVRQLHRDTASLAAYVPDDVSALPDGVVASSGAASSSSSSAVVPGVGGIAAIGTVDWMTHKLGAGALFAAPAAGSASEGAAATSSSSATAPISAIDRQWMNRFTLPLSVVKLALSATNFAAGPPSATLASMWKSAAEHPVASSALPVAAAQPVGSAARCVVDDDDDDSVVVVAPTQPPLTVGKRPRADDSEVASFDLIDDAPAAKRRAGPAGPALPVALAGALAMPELAYGVRARPSSDGIPRVAFSELLAADAAASGAVLTTAFASAMFEAEMRALQ